MSDTDSAGLSPMLQKRFHRLRRHPALRNMVRENHLRSSDLIMPLFITEGKGIREEIFAMPGQFRYSLEQALEAIAQWMPTSSRSGLSAVILFGVIDDSQKDPQGSYALKSEKDQGIIPLAVAAVKSHFPNLLVITDLCFCEYTDHGHCGILTSVGELDNDRTLDILGKQAVVHAQAGADIVAPSGMVDGMVEVIRHALDETGYTGVGIMSYAVKYASAFYGPFREAVKSAPSFGDRKGYQMDPANSREAIREAQQDMEEGADILMVKPGLPYLDIIQQVSHHCDLPVAGYQVSGEYAMIKWAAKNGGLDEEASIHESLLAFKRAGASLIISYFAADIVKDLPQ